MTAYQPIRLLMRYSVVAIVCLTIVGGSISPGWAVPKSTSTKQYCGCTCGSNQGTKFLYWEKRYSCGLAEGQACKMDLPGTKGVPGTLHSCQDCTRTETGGFRCAPQGMAPGGGARVPSTGQLEQVVPRGIESTQEIEPPPVESEKKGK